MTTNMLNLLRMINRDPQLLRDVSISLKSNLQAAVLSPELHSYLTARENETINVLPLLDYLRKNKESRGIMADLRGALVENKMRKAWPILVRFGGVGEDHDSDVVRHVAGWYALHPLESESGNIGDTCRFLLTDEERTKVKNIGETGPLSKRFLHLLEADDEEIFKRITQFILRAKALNISVNYLNLYKDLLRWSNDADRVREDWAWHFWVMYEGEQT